MNMVEVIVTIIGALGFLSLVILYSTFCWGFVCYKFYEWFVVSMFVGLPHIHYYQGIGLMMFITLFKNQSSTSSSSKDDNKNSKFVPYLQPWLVFLIGCLVKAVWF